MNKGLWCGAAALVLGVGLCLGAGCQTREQILLRTGTINSTVVLQSDDKYQELSRQYFQERIKASTEVQKLVEKHSNEEGVLSDRSVYEKLLKIQNEVESKWQKKTADYINAKMRSMQSAAEKVAADHKLDLVLIDSNDVPTVEYGAQDVTAQVMGSMPGFAGSSEAPAPEATASPAPTASATPQSK